MAGNGPNPPVAPGKPGAAGNSPAGEASPLGNFINSAVATVAAPVAILHWFASTSPYGELFFLATIFGPPLAVAAIAWLPSSGLCDAALALCFLAVLAWSPKRLLAIWRRPAAWPLLALAAWFALSAAWSFHPVGTLRDLSKSLPLALGVLSMPILLGTRDRLRLALWLWAGAVTLRVAADAVQLCATRGFPAVFGEARFAADFLWTHPNVASMMASLAALVWMGLLPVANRKWGRVLSLAGFAVCTAYVWLLGSRGPQAVFALGILLWPVVCLPGWRAKCAVLAACAAAATGLWFAAPRLNPRFAEVRTMAGANRRTDIWGHAWMLAKQRPATGWGYGKKAFERLVYDNPAQRAPDVPVRFPHAHSFWLMLPVQGGAIAAVLGVLAWGTVLGSVLLRLRRSGTLRGRSDLATLFTLIAVILAYGVADYPDSGLRLALWLLAGAALAPPPGTPAVQEGRCFRNLVFPP